MGQFLVLGFLFYGFFFFFKEIIVTTFPNLMKNINLEIHKAQGGLSTINTKKTTLRHIKVKLLKKQRQRKDLKISQREKKEQGEKMTTDILSAFMGAGMQCTGTFKMLKGARCSDSRM